MMQSVSIFKLCAQFGGDMGDLSYLLTGVTATGDDGHTADLHDCRIILVSMES